MQVLAEILGGGASSRLYKTLVLDRGLALSAGAHYSPGAIDLAAFGVYAAPKPGVSVGELETAIDAELQRLVGQFRYESDGRERAHSSSAAEQVSRLRELSATSALRSKRAS